MVISVYVPQDLGEKCMLWNYLLQVINRWDDHVLVIGDFNEVKSEAERFGLTLNASGLLAFNDFIAAFFHLDVPFGGYNYTWSLSSGEKMSKLDRFLVP